MVLVDWGKTEPCPERGWRLPWRSVPGKRGWLWRTALAGQLLIQLGHDQTGDLQRIVGFPKGRLEIASIERRKQVCRQLQHQPEEEDGVGMMAVDVIGVPAVGQFIEGTVLYVPAIMTDPHYCFGGGPRSR